MTASEDMAERHGRMLARYAELALSMAEDVHAAAAAAQDPDQKARLAEGFHKLGRAMRQSMALEARFVRDQARDRRAAQIDAAEAGRAAVRRRQDQVRAVVERQIYCEIEPNDASVWLADLNERLEEEALYDGFDDESLEDHIARLSADLGLTGETQRNYTPRSCRPRFPEPRWTAWDDAADFGDVADDDEDEGEDEDLDGEAPHDAPAPPPECKVDAAPVPEPPPPEPPPPEPPPPEPPPPRPPDPEPYVPPWERSPGGRFPGGSGY